MSQKLDKLDSNGSSCTNSSSMRTRVGNYELGRTLGSGNFAKVKLARNLDTGKQVAIKILEKNKIVKDKMTDQIKREVSTMKLVKHPNIVELYEVMASKSKIYFVLEYVTEGELFSKIARRGKLKEEDALAYFQQLIDAVDYCHSRGVYHRDLKPENLLLDTNGTLKISDFGLSALPQHFREDGLLHTACGTPNYVAPEIIVDKGYDGAKVDIWSCGVILFVLMAGYLPFNDSNLMAMYKKIYKAEFSFPEWFSPGAKRLITRVLTPNPKHRINVSQILEDPWFKKGYKPEKHAFFQKVKLDDVEAVFDDESIDQLAIEQQEFKIPRPTFLNAFELISFNKGLNLSSLFEKEKEVKLETRFTSKCSAPEIISKMEETAKPLGFYIQKRDYKMKFQGKKIGRKGHLSIATEVFEVTPSLFLVEVRKSSGDTLEYQKFYHKFSTSLKDIMWTTEDMNVVA
ncbi:hypothetical protein GOP47_0010414 [Adiantum capillus-veneris]|uniref:non-specific serine/threonine protein kinase n=1 Tax=Adiantum capillus-veneris TaxID=13818 RepID=A0A9D4ZGA5_ADICA|nr:hypothetical protein GOP47_0010414 [Adiantum capillus-veneris]